MKDRNRSICLCFSRGLTTGGNEKVSRLGKNKQNEYVKERKTHFYGPNFWCKETTDMSTLFLYDLLFAKISIENDWSQASGTLVYKSLFSWVSLSGKPLACHLESLPKTFLFKVNIIRDQSGHSMPFIPSSRPRVWARKNQFNSSTLAISGLVKLVHHSRGDSAFDFHGFSHRERAISWSLPEFDSYSE